MSKIKILDSGLNPLATLAGVFSASRTEKINSENILTFETTLRDDTMDLIDGDTVFELDEDYFDIAYYKSEQRENGGLEIAVEAEHVSYRLNDSDYDVEYFTETGTPTYILGKILDGTGFTVGTVEYSDEVTFSLQQASSRRGLLMQFIAYLGGEALFNQFAVSAVAHRGSTDHVDLVAGKNVRVLSRAVDKRTLDDEGNPTVSYTCGLIKPVELSLGDEVYLKNVKLDIDVTLRIVSITKNPYRSWEVSVEVGNYVNALEDDLYRIETEKVSKDALMNGCRIGPEYGFEAVRNDKKARAYMNSTNLAFQTGDGSGSSWVNKLYYDVDTETGLAKLVFDGELSATLITALSALVTPNFYAGKATISELTVDQVDTSDKVQKYLSSDGTDDNFQRLYDQFHEWVTAQTDGLEANKVQATNRDGDLLYWVDATHTAATTTDTGLPVYTYAYTETNKLRIGFRLDPGVSGYYYPMMEIGAGTGVGDNGKGFIYKGLSGLYLDYYSATDGSLRRIILGDDGIVLTPYALESIDFYDNGFRVVYSGDTVALTWTLNADGTIATLVTEDMETIPVTWHAGDM